MHSDAARATQAAADTFRELARARRALSGMESSIVDTQVAIATVPAPTGGERERAQWIERRFSALGFRTRTDAAGNVVASAPGAYEDAPVVLCAHLDTVFPPETPLHVSREGDRLIGPGICDNGRGLAAMLAIADVIARGDVPITRPVEFVATTGEEGAGNLRGARHYFATARRPFAVIALDGAGDERIVNTALGSRRFRIAFTGPGGHSWSAFGMVNPVHAAARTGAALAALRLPGGGRSALSVCRIGGGLSVNALPEEAWLEVDARSTSATALERMEREIRDATVASAAAENASRVPGTPALASTIERIGDRPGGQTAADSALVAAAMEATRLVGRSPELATASTDANAAIAAGLPAIAIGAGGRGGDAHSSREWFDPSGGLAGVERALTIVATMARLSA